MPSSSSLLTTIGHLINLLFSVYSCKESKSIVGVSIKSFELYTIAFALQLFITNDVATAFIRFLCIILILYFINLVHNEEPYKSAFLASESHNDSFPHWKYILLPCILLAMMTNFIEENFTLSQQDSSDGRRFAETVSLFCLYIESAALIPQIALLYRFREIENFKWYNIIALCVQNLSYIVSVLFMNNTIVGQSNSSIGGIEGFEGGYDRKGTYYEGWFPLMIEFLAGLLQTSLCLRFVYLFVHIKFQGGGTLEKLQ